MILQNRSLLISIDTLLEERMLNIKGQSVMMDTDVAKLLEVSLQQLQRMVRDNRDRFPKKFMLTLKPVDLNATPIKALKGRKKIYFFTWGGIMMAAGQIRTNRAIDISIQLTREYVKGDFKLFREVFDK